MEFAAILAAIFTSALGVAFYTGRRTARNDASLELLKQELAGHAATAKGAAEKNEKAHAWLFKASNRILGHLGLEVD